MTLDQQRNNGGNHEPQGFHTETPRPTTMSQRQLLQQEQQQQLNNRQNNFQTSQSSSTSSIEKPQTVNDRLSMLQREVDALKLHQRRTHRLCIALIAILLFSNCYLWAKVRRWDYFNSDFNWWYPSPMSAAHHHHHHHGASVSEFSHVPTSGSENSHGSDHEDPPPSMPPMPSRIPSASPDQPSSQQEKDNNNNNKERQQPRWNSPNACEDLYLHVQYMDANLRRMQQNMPRLMKIDDELQRIYRDEKKLKETLDTFKNVYNSFVDEVRSNLEKVVTYINDNL